MNKIRRLLLAVLCLSASVGNAENPAASSKAKSEDGFLDNLVGSWHLTRKIRGKIQQSTVDADWVLDHHFLRVHIKDVAVPAKYEAEVFLGYDSAKGRYVAHWLDTFGPGFSLMGFGTRTGDSIPFVFEDSEGTVRNTFTFDSHSQTWTCLIVQKVKGGEWETFAEEQLKRP